MNHGFEIAIRCSSLGFRYAPTRPLIFEGFDLTIPKGSFWAIEGDNGVGKSTMLRLIAGLLKPTAGTIELAEGRIEYLHQDYARSLFAWRTVAWNICLPLIVRGLVRRHEIYECAGDLAGRMGITVPLSDYPFRLSGGQRHLVTLLRALAADPHLLLLDEPATGLAPENAVKIWKTIDRFKMERPGLTILCVSHDSINGTRQHDVFRLKGQPAKLEPA